MCRGVDTLPLRSLPLATPSADVAPPSPPKVLLLVGLLLLAILGCDPFIRDVLGWSVWLTLRAHFGMRGMPVVLVALAATGGAWLLARRDNRVGRPARIAALALVGWCGAVAIAGPHRQSYAVLLLGRAHAVRLRARGGAGAESRRRRARRRCAPRCLVTAGLVAVAVVVDAETTWRADAVRRPGGLFGNRNYAAEYLALLLPLLLWRARERWRPLLLVTVGAALALTRCRTAWLACGAGVGVLLVAAWSERRTVARGVALLVLGGLVASAIPNRLSWSDARPLRSTASRLFDLGSGSGAMRLEQYKQTLRLVWRHPAGLGPGGWQPAMTAVAPALAVNRNPHSEYLRALSDGGVAALGALVVLLGWALRGAWRARRPALLAAWATLALICVADCPLWRPEMIAAALLLAYLLQTRVREQGEIPRVDCDVQRVMRVYPL